MHRLAETRRKKVQELEKKIAELTRKCMEQNKIIRGKEKQDQRIKTLSNEIQSLKETRVKLIRQMRNDANNFTKWKQSKEKEINKLRAQDRKRAYEMVRMKIEHNKQENVFKRKMEEAFAVNKRLKVRFFAKTRSNQIACLLIEEGSLELCRFVSIKLYNLCTGCIGDAEKGDAAARKEGQ